MKDIVDAGGGIIDVSAYKRLSESGGPNFRRFPSRNVISRIRLHDAEISKAHSCTCYMSNLSKRRLTLRDLDGTRDCSDKTTKARFRYASDPPYIKFGKTRENDPSDIRFGQLRGPGVDVANFYPSIDCIVSAVIEQKKSALKDISVSEILLRWCTPFKLRLEHAVLVGGFAASDYLFDRVKAQFGERNFFIATRR